MYSIANNHRQIGQGRAQAPLQHLHTQHIVVHERNIQGTTCGTGAPETFLVQWQYRQEHDIRKNWACAKDALQGMPYVWSCHLIKAEQGLSLLYIWQSATLSLTLICCDPTLKEDASNVQTLGRQEYARALLPERCQGLTRVAHGACSWPFMVSQVCQLTGAALNT